MAGLPPMPPETIEAILDMRAAGMLHVEIAYRIGYSSTAVGNQIKKAVLRGDPRATVDRNSARNARIFALWQEGRSASSLAREFHLSKSTIKSMTERAGLQRRELKSAPEQIAQALAMWGEGARQIDIAKATGLTEAQVRYRIAKLYRDGDERVQTRPPPSARVKPEPEPEPEPKPQTPSLPEVVAGFRVVRRIAPNDGVLIALPYLRCLHEVTP